MVISLKVPGIYFVWDKRVKEGKRDENSYQWRNTDSLKERSLQVPLLIPHLS